jgi:hypothetical protein
MRETLSCADARLAGKSRAFCPPPNEASGAHPLKAPQATFSQ